VLGRALQAEQSRGGGAAAEHSSGGEMAVGAGLVAQAGPVAHIIPAIEGLSVEIAGLCRDWTYCREGEAS